MKRERGAGGGWTGGCCSGTKLVLLLFAEACEECSAFCQCAMSIFIAVSHRFSLVHLLDPSLMGLRKNGHRRLIRSIFPSTTCCSSSTFPQIPGNEEEENGGASSSPEEELARRFKDVMRRIFWDRFTQSLLPPPDPNSTAAAAAADATNTSGGGGAAAAGGGSGDGGGAKTEDVAEVPGLPSLRVGSKVHSRYGSEQGSYYVATVLAVEKAKGKGTASTAGGGEDGGVFVDVRYDEDGMVERGVPVSRLKKKNDPPDFEPLLALLGEVGGSRCDEHPGKCYCAFASNVRWLCHPLGEYRVFLGVEVLTHSPSVANIVRLLIVE